jgi:hypothetical protein
MTWTRRQTIQSIAVWPIATRCLAAPPEDNIERRSVVIYGATPAGLIAAIQLKKYGVDCVVLEPSGHLGGMTTGGLGATDIGNKSAIGGMAREFYRRIFQTYQEPTSWRQQKPSEYRGPHQKPGETTQWTFEPHVATEVFRKWLDDARVEVRLHAPIDRTAAAKKESGNLRRVRMEAGYWVEADAWIDATYEGDLMALAGVESRIGREANSEYGESLNGLQVAQATKHQFLEGISGYRVPGDPTSGLLRWISPEKTPGPDGTGDLHVQAYCLRMCLTDDPTNQIPFPAPPDYNPENYELLLRQCERGLPILPWHSLPMPNRKTDTNNNTGFSTDAIGLSDRWPEATYEDRATIYLEHLHYQQGLCWTMVHHPRVPTKLRQQAAQWGLCQDEFQSDRGWSPQLYVREARRMVGRYRMTEANCRGKERVEDSVGMAAYTMDSHNVQRYVDPQGIVRNEGDVQVGGFPPYPISYRSLLPKAGQCENLLVPVALSATHIAYGSIRMEPVFMVLGQSAAAAIHLAEKNKTSIPELPYPILREELLSLGQVLG